MSRSKKHVLHAVTLLLALAALTPAHATDGVAWNRQVNITKSAERLAERQKAVGALGAYRFISSCYSTQLLAEKFTQGLESCIVEDYIHSKVTSEIYNRLDQATRSRIGAPSPEALVAGMSNRVGDAFAHYKLQREDALALITLIEKHGMPAFAKARFPGDKKSQ